jgi:three-Cys-motif partner protein
MPSHTKARTRGVKYDEIGYWSEIKLDILRNYAAAYSTIVSKSSPIKRHIYVDAFAGAGTHKSRTTGEFVPGSPANALLVDPPFSEFHFIDLDGRRAAQLRRLAKNRSDVHVYEGDCNKILLEDVFPRCRYQDYARAHCLLDPYALNIDWNVLQTAGRMRSVEIFYSFMIMDANMNVLWRNPDKVPERQLVRMDRSWGDRSWRDSAYTRQPGLFGEIEEKAANEAILGALQHRLAEVAGFTYVPDPLPMRNSTGAVVYYLVFASPNRTGARIVTEIYNKFRERGAH